MKKILAVLVIATVIVSGCTSLKEKKETRMKEYNQYIEEKKNNPSIYTGYEKKVFLESAFEKRKIIKWPKNEIYFLLEGKFKDSEFDAFKQQMVEESFFEIQDVMKEIGHDVRLVKYDTMRDLHGIPKYDVKIQMSNLFKYVQKNPKYNPVIDTTKYIQKERVDDPKIIEDDIPLTGIYDKENSIFYKDAIKITEMEIKYNQESILELSYAINPINKRFKPIYDIKKNILKKADIFIPIPKLDNYSYTEEEKNVIKSLIKREILMGLGLNENNDPVSILNFHNFKDFKGMLTPIDISLVKMLYNPNIEPNMTEKEFLEKNLF